MQAEFPTEIKVLGRDRSGKVVGEIRTPQYMGDCPSCGGTGWMSAFVVSENYIPDGAWPCQSWVDGKMRWGYRHRAFCPSCNGPTEKAYLTRFSNLVGSDIEIRIDQFDPLMGKAPAKTRATQLLALVPRPAGFVTFYGSYGVGKTFLLKAMINQFRLAQVRSRYTSMTSLLAEVRSMFGDQTRDAADALIARYQTTPVLAIDEVDRVQKTEWALDTIFRVLDERYMRRDGCLTMLATNSDPANMPPEMGYLGSRMMEDAVHIGGEDMRKS